MTEGVESINKKSQFRVTIGALRKEKIMARTMTTTVSVLFGLIKIRRTKTKRSA